MAGINDETGQQVRQMDRQKARCVKRHQESAKRGNRPDLNSLTSETPAEFSSH